MLCLGIESSCDETAVALVEDGRLVDQVLASQIDIHALFGGIVPELASREHYRHLGALYDTLAARQGLNAGDLDVVAAARGPGLLGCLLVGMSFAKALSLASGASFLGVNHLHAHLLAAGLEQDLPFPMLGLLVSGGHTNLYLVESPSRMRQLGRTIDDAAGEAFDKVAKILGLPYPGGRLIDELGVLGRADPRLFPRPYLNNPTLDFSFSGLKTAVATWLDQHPELREDLKLLKAAEPQSASGAICGLCASFTSAVVDVLRIKTERALEAYPQVNSLVVAGGVAANSALRKSLADLMKQRKGRLVLPSLSLCTDNAAMIAHAAWLLAGEGLSHPLSIEAVPRGRVIPDDFILSRIQSTI